MARYTNPVPRYTDDSGLPLADGLLYFYETGTSTLADTYADSGQTILNSNPVVLSGAGEVPNTFFTGTLKSVLRKSTGEQVWERDPVTSGSGGGLVTDWDSKETYDASDIVRYDLIYYISLVNNNLDNEPDSSSQWATYPNGDIECDSVTADEFIGDLTGDVTGNVTGDLTGTADDSDALGGLAASEYLPDASTLDVNSGTLTQGVGLQLRFINMGTVNAGSVILVMGNANFLCSAGEIIECEVGWSGSAVATVNGYVFSQATRGVVFPPSSTTVNANPCAIIDVTTTGTLTLRLTGEYTAGAATMDYNTAHMATAYLIKKA